MVNTMLRKEINFVYKDKSGIITRRKLSNYSVSKKNDQIYITGHDSLRNNAIRKFLRNQIITKSVIDENIAACHHCGGKYKDNNQYVLNNEYMVTLCLVDVQKEEII